MARSTCCAAWLTDIHLNFVWDRKIAGAFETEHGHLIEEVLATDPDALLVGGDIAEARSSFGTWSNLKRPCRASWSTLSWAITIFTAARFKECVRR